MGYRGFWKKLALTLYTGITIAATAICPVATIALMAVPATYHVLKGIDYYTKGKLGYSLFEGIKSLGALFRPYLYGAYQFITLFFQPFTPDINNPKYRP